ncbi:MAG: MFS transporter, partial [Bacteriovoracaceae bacterium]
IIGGLMSGNISTATAVVADVTEQKNRSRGMAFVGIAFAAGFTIGPAMGGILSTVNLLDYYPNLESWGINPFSLAALVAFILSAINFKYIWKNFEETLPEEKRGKTKNSRSANPVKLFLPLPYKGVNLTNYSNFLFLLAFSGMEFTLTFLAFERLKFTSLQNGFMFIFIGFILAMVQGGFVRRKAGQIGEKKVALMGMILLMPGLLAIGFASSVWLLFLGLFFLATGSAMIVPCLTSLVSLYSPAENQGESLGVFRSLGALARVFGPIIASVVYWHYGSQYPYYFGTFFLLIPIALVFSLPKPELKKA